MSTQWDPISLTVKVKIAYDEHLFETKTLKYMVIKVSYSQSRCYIVAGLYVVTNSMNIVSFQPITKLRFMSLALLIEIYYHYDLYVFKPSIGCVVELLLFSLCSRHHCHVTLLSLHCC